MPSQIYHYEKHMKLRGACGLLDIIHEADDRRRKRSSRGQVWPCLTDATDIVQHEDRRCNMHCCVTYRYRTCVTKCFMLPQ